MTLNTETKIDKRQKLIIWLHTWGHLALVGLSSLLTLVSTCILLAPVINKAGDNLYHVMNEYALRMAVDSGDSIFGPVSVGFGQPITRFYQALYYLHNLSINLGTGLDIKFIHNFTIVVCFAASPFAYYYFLRKLGLRKWAASIGSFASMISVAAFGNSIEAYHQAGIVTQSMGGLFFPLFMGTFMGMLRGENRITSTALLFAITFLSHVILSVFAVFGGVLYFLVTRTRIRATWYKIAAFGMLAACLVSFWALPFISHTLSMRPVPDSIIRRGVMWFTSVSQEELAMVVTSGRMLDDPMVRHPDQVDPRDKLMDKINIMGTYHLRPPVLTVLVALGAIIALFGFRKNSHRFLLSGFVFSLMLFAGPDDYRWLRWLPFINQIQTFRCVYLAEFFAFGLVGIGLEALFGALSGLICCNGPHRKKLVSTWFVLAIVLFGFGCYEIVAIGQTHLRRRDMTSLNKIVDAASGIENQGYPFRISPRFGKRIKRQQAWLAVHGFNPYCTHWKAVGPTSAYYNCRSLGKPQTNRDLYALAGIRYFIADQEHVDPFEKINRKDKDPLFERIPNGKDRLGNDNSDLHALDSGYDSFLRPFAGTPTTVVCSDEQWVWLLKAWTRKYKTRLREPTTPIPLRVKAGTLKDHERLLMQTRSLVYLDSKFTGDDAQVAKRLLHNRGEVVSAMNLGLPRARILDPKKKIWNQLPQKKGPKKPLTALRQETDGVYKNTWIVPQYDGTHTRQRFTFDVDTLEPVVAILPMEAVPGWTAKIDGAPVHLYPSSMDMAAVVLPEGAHRVEFKWQMPQWHAKTIRISLGVLFAIFIIRLFEVMVRKKPKRI